MIENTKTVFCSLSQWEHSRRQKWVLAPLGLASAHPPKVQDVRLRVTAGLSRFQSWSWACRVWDVHYRQVGDASMRSSIIFVARNCLPLQFFICFPIGTTAHTLNISNVPILIPANTMVFSSLLAVWSHPRYWSPSNIASWPLRWIISFLRVKPLIRPSKEVYYIVGW